MGEATGDADRSLSIVGAVRRFGSHVVLDGIDLAVDPGKVVAVVGANGSGKSTLLRVLANVLRLQGGHRSGPKRIAFLPAVVTAPPLTVGTWLRSVARLDGQSVDDAVGLLDELGFDATVESSASSLSTGNLRKMFLASTLCADGLPILLDEPVASLDEQGRDAVAARITAQSALGVPVVVADHDRQWLSTIATTVYEISGGRLRQVEKTARTPSSTQVRLTLQGPTSRRDELVASAEALGFHEAP